jgi:hypothetical protein
LFKYDYYTLGSRINYTKGSLKPKHVSRDILEFSKAISLNVQNILFAIEDNVMHRRSKPEDPSMAPNPHRLEPTTGIPRQHHQQEEEAPHLHTGHNKSKV